MRALELYEAVGRDSQHIEDILYIEGTQSAVNALEQLKDIVDNPQRLQVKWDGAPAVRFGRDQDGAFHFADKYAKQIVSTPGDLKDYYMSKVKGEPSQSRLDFIQKMVSLHPVFEKGTPQDFRGFVHADLLWSTTPSVKNGEFVFEPNTVRYFVDTESTLGNMISMSTAGAAAVMYQEDFDGKFGPIGNQWKTLGSDDLVIVGPISAIETRVDIDTAIIDDLISQVKANSDAIEEFIQPEPGLADIRAIIYNFINQQAAAGSISNLSDRFVSWVEKHPKLSKGKKEKTIAKAETNPTGMKALFSLVEKTSDVKRQIIAQLESATLKKSAMRAELIDGTPGGEGFVDSSGAKLVDRETFSRANFGRAR